RGYKRYNNCCVDRSKPPTGKLHIKDALARTSALNPCSPVVLVLSVSCSSLIVKLCLANLLMKNNASVEPLTFQLTRILTENKRKTIRSNRSFSFENVNSLLCPIEKEYKHWPFIHLLGYPYAGEIYKTSICNKMESKRTVQIAGVVFCVLLIVSEICCYPPTYSHEDYEQEKHVTLIYCTKGAKR
ncbi:hypothetical protein Ocin01_17484, partial [Orchesella cincta]